jgi:hypothetical protein
VKTLTTLPDIALAHAIRLALEEEDIPAFVRGEYSPDILAGGVAVVVRDEDLERARAVLRRFEAGNA